MRHVSGRRRGRGAASPYIDGRRATWRSRKRQRPSECRTRCSRGLLFQGVARGGSAGPRRVLRTHPSPSRRRGRHAHVQRNRTCTTSWIAGSSSPARAMRSGARAASSRTRAGRRTDAPTARCEPPPRRASRCGSCAWVAKVQGGCPAGATWPRGVGGASTRKGGASRSSASLREDAGARFRRGGRRPAARTDPPHWCRLSSDCVSLMSGARPPVRGRGNLVALEEVLKDAEAARGRRFLAATSARGHRGRSRRSSRLRGAGDTTWIRGNRQALAT